jgi:periplasmic protein TonB
LLIGFTQTPFLPNFEPNGVERSSRVKLETKCAGIRFARTSVVLHLDDVGPPAPRLQKQRRAVLTQVAVSATLHVASVLAIVTLVPPTLVPPAQGSANQPIAQQQSLDIRHIVFLAPDPRQIGTGGGGGGNRQPGPVRRAQGVGSDTITLRVKEPAPATASFTEVSPLAQVVLDAKPLASGTFDQIGLPTGGVSYGTSTGPGSGGGVGTGIGTGIGSGRGPGIGPGSGGGIGGGIYRPGGAVTTPRVIAEVKPTYTNEALLHKIQGTVVLELVVTREGRPSQIRVVRSLDPGGLDEQAVTAAAQWRFEPGHLAGTPVNVLVTIMLDFWIR